MKIIRDLSAFKEKGAIIALGNFDGVHKGHQKIIKTAIRYAWLKKKPSVVITFDPHPQLLVAPQRGLKLLTTLPERAALVEELGADYLVVLKFDRKLCSLSAIDFVRQILIKKLRAATVFVGFDFAFGKGRSGTAEALRKLGEKQGLEIKIVRPVRDIFQIIKSSIIRDCLTRGDLRKAVKLLGRGYILEGKVVKGIGRGKGLGFPTANLEIALGKLIPAHGVYAGYAWLEGKKYKAAVYIGSRPTFAEKKVAIEAHLLNFKREVRGLPLRLELLEYFHGDLQFADVDKLKEQIRRDIVLIQRKKRL